MGRSRQDKRLLSGFGLEFIGGFAAANRYPSRIDDSSSTKAVNFSSARTPKRFPSSRCASATKIVRPRESTAETQSQLRPALLRLSAIISILHSPRILPLFVDAWQFSMTCYVPFA